MLLLSLRSALSQHTLPSQQTVSLSADSVVPPEARTLTFTPPETSRVRGVEIVSSRRDIKEARVFLSPSLPSSFSVDLASPLLAYKVASLLFNQEVPVWLDVIIGSAALAALYVVISGDTSLDAYLQ